MLTFIIMDLKRRIKSPMTWFIILKEKDLISNYEFRDDHGILWVKSHESMSKLLALLIEKGYSIQSVLPIDKDLESLYKRIYK